MICVRGVGRTERILAARAIRIDAVVTNPSPGTKRCRSKEAPSSLVLMRTVMLVSARSASETEIQRWAERFVEPVDSMRYLLSSRCSRTFAEPSIPTSLMYATASSSVQKERYSGSISTFGCFSAVAEQEVLELLRDIDPR